MPTMLLMAGIIFSTLHQSSLGTLFLIVPHKLSSIWYSPILPVSFFVSAVAAGVAMVIVESTASAWYFGRKVEADRDAATCHGPPRRPSDPIWPAGVGTERCFNGVDSI
jgi:Ni/Fe-hydrogenase subunit HybB-like protein